MTSPPDILLGLSPADRAELTRLLVEQAEAYEEWLAGKASRLRVNRYERALAAWTRARLALIAAQGPRSTVAL